MILYNAIKTPDGTIIESKFTNDYVCHKDANGNTYCVDGGHMYLRRSFSSHPDFEDISEYDDGSHEKRVEYLKWGNNYDKNMNLLPCTKWIKIKDMETSHIKSIIDGDFCKDKFYKEVFINELKNRENERR